MCDSDYLQPLNPQRNKYVALLDKLHVRSEALLNVTLHKKISLGIWYFT